MGLLKKFAGQTVIYGIGSILSRIVYYLLVVGLLAYLLGEETVEFGTFSYFYAWAALLIPLFSFRLDTALFRFGNKNADINTALFTAFTPIVGSGILLALIGTLCDQVIADIIGFHDHPHYVRWIAYILAFDVINLIPYAKLRLENKAKAYTLYRIFNVSLSSLLIIFFLIVLPKFQDGFLSFIPQRAKIIDWVFIANLIASGILFLSLLPQLKGFKLLIDKVLLKKMLRYVFPLVIVGIASGFIQYFATPLIKMLGSGNQAENLAEAGVYDFTRRIAGLFVMFTTAFNYAAEPFFFNNSSDEVRETLYGKICRLFTLVGGFIVIGMYLGTDILKLFAPSDYWESIYLLPVLLMAYLLLGIYYNISIWYKLSDNTKYGAYLSLLGMAVTLSISIALIPVIGYAASAWATLFSYLIMVIGGYLLGQKIYPISYPVLKIFKDILVITTLLIIAYLIKENTSEPITYICSFVLVMAYLIYSYKAEEGEWNKMLSRNQ